MRGGKLTDKLAKIGFRILLGLLLTIIIILPCNVQPVKAESRNIIATYGKGYLEDVDGLLVLHVEGNPYEMGYQNGFLLKDSIQAQIQYTIQSIMDMGYSYEYLVNCAQAMEPHIPQEYVEEMQGLADGASMNYTDVLLAHMQIDIILYGPGWTGCSGFVVFGNATKDGHLYHGRSLDFSLPPEPIGLITVYEPENGNAFVNVGSFGFIGLHTGMNKEGITFGSKMSLSADQTLDGMPAGFVNRKIVQYSNNLTQAVDIECQTDKTVSGNIVLGDGKNLNACVIEMSANYCEVFWAGDPAEDVEPHYSIPNAVRRTNHYVDPELAATQRDPYDPRDAEPEIVWEHSWLRYEKLSQLIVGNYSNIDAEMSIEFLKTPPVAWYPINEQSTVFDSTNLELWVACANSTTPAYEREFIYLSYDDLFSEYLFDLTITSTAGGNVTNPGEGTFICEKGTEVNLVAEPEEGYYFVNWTGNVSTVADVEDATTTITIEDDYDITANFESSLGCFIATAAYGTPMADQVQILRDFRDSYLLSNPLGQALVHLYYTISPPIAEFITDNPSLKPIVRAGLVPVVVISAVAVNTTIAEKMVIIGLVVLVSVAVVVWTMRRRSRGSEYT